MISSKVMPSKGWDFWAAVTDVPCPFCENGIVRWAEAGYVPGYRVCDGCGQHMIAKGNAKRPVLSPVTEVDDRCYGAASEGAKVEPGQPYRWGAGVNKPDESDE